MNPEESHANRVSQVVWRWREPAASASGRHKSPQDRAFLQALIPAAVSAVFFYRHHPIPGTIVAVLAGLILALACFAPSAFLAFEKGSRKFGEWVATGVTWLLLVPFYYLCFVPGRLMILLTGKDPLNRRFPSPAPTHWIPRPPVKDPAQYRKQF